MEVFTVLEEMALARSVLFKLLSPHSLQHPFHVQKLCTTGFQGIQLNCREELLLVLSFAHGLCEYKVDQNIIRC